MHGLDLRLKEMAFFLILSEIQMCIFILLRSREIKNDSSSVSVSGFAQSVGCPLSRSNF